MDGDVDLAFAVDSAVRNSKQHGLKGNKFKTKKVRLAIERHLPADDPRSKQVFELVEGRHEYN